jgi:hypothetical protein
MRPHGRACVCERCWQLRWQPANEGIAPLEPSLLDERILKQTLRLVHPDAQPEGRRELATAVTQHLLGALEALRRERTAG